jgi:hypothetical protein
MSVRNHGSEMKKWNVNEEKSYKSIDLKQVSFYTTKPLN